MPRLDLKPCAVPPHTCSIASVLSRGLLDTIDSRADAAGRSADDGSVPLELESELLGAAASPPPLTLVGDATPAAAAAKALAERPPDRLEDSALDVLGADALQLAC